MSDTENQEIDNAPQEDVQETAETPEVPEVNAAEAKARAKGWVGLEEWKEQGKNPDDWAPYKFFNEKGDMISQIQQLKRQQKDVDSRLSMNNEFWKAQLEAQKTSLESSLEEAVESADTARVKQITGQMNDVSNQLNNLNQQVSVPQVDPQDIAVEESYFKSLSTRPKQLYAQEVAGPLVNSGLSGQALVDAVSEAVNREFPAQNQRRNNAASVTDSPRKPVAAKEQKYSIDNLSKEDKAILTSLKNVPSFKGKSDLEILKALEDSKR